MFRSGPRGAVGCVAEVPGGAWHDPAGWLEADGGVAADHPLVDEGFPAGTEFAVGAAVAALGCRACPACHQRAILRRCQRTNQYAGPRVQRPGMVQIQHRVMASTCVRAVLSPAV